MLSKFSLFERIEIFGIDIENFRKYKYLKSQRDIYTWNENT